MIAKDIHDTNSHLDVFRKDNKKYQFILQQNRVGMNLEERIIFICLRPKTIIIIANHSSISENFHLAAKLSVFFF